MGFIIIGILLAGGFVFYSFFVKIEPDTVARASVLIAFVGLLAGVFIPTGGYKPIEEVQTVELHALNDSAFLENGAVFYVKITDENDYAYYTQVDSDFATKNSKAYISKSISKDDATIVEEENCEFPRLSKYIREPNKTFWSFGLLGTKEFNVFYIPEGTLSLGIATRQ